jgi:cell fate regulator YaaT (PSP1 superfamily)
MGCGNCGTGANGTPSGCKSNGSCTTGGCNRLNVYDWLNALPLQASTKPYPIIEMSFSKGSRKEFFRNNTHHIIEKGDWLTVEGLGGYDVGQVSITGELVKLQLKKYGVKEQEVTKRVLHPATTEEQDECAKQKTREAEVLMRSRAIARTLNLDMKLCEVEIQADSKKGTFFYTADQRVDFRELIKLYAGDFKMKVEMRQIGARQESGKVGGIGSCGRELCCSTWLTDFKSVNTTAARYQNLSINQTKLSGQCGRLKCCLNYELDTYMDALSVFPDHADALETIKGIAHLQKRDIFKNLMWYSYSDNNKQYPLTITRVKEIQVLNKQGQKAEELQPVELETRDSKAGIKADMGFVNDVGQVTLKALEKNSKKKKKPGDGNKARADEPAQVRQGGAAPRLPEAETGGGQPKSDRPRPNNQQQGRAQQPKVNNQPKLNKTGQDAPTPKGQQAPGGNQPKKNNAQQAGNRDPQQQKGANQPQGNRPRPNDTPPGNDTNVAANPLEPGSQQQPKSNRPPQGNRPPRPPREATAGNDGTPVPGGAEQRGQQPKRNDRPQNNQNQQKRPRPPRPDGQNKPPQQDGEVTGI